MEPARVILPVEFSGLQNPQGAGAVFAYGRQTAACQPGFRSQMGPGSGFRVESVQATLARANPQPAQVVDEHRGYVPSGQAVGVFGFRLVMHPGAAGEAVQAVLCSDPECGSEGQNKP